MVVGSNNTVLGQRESGSRGNMPLSAFATLIKSANGEHGILATRIELLGMYAFKLKSGELDGRCSPIQLTI